MTVLRAAILYFVDEPVISFTWRDLTYAHWHVWHVKYNYSNLFHAGFKKLGQNVANNQFTQNLEEIPLFKLLLQSASKSMHNKL